jgi:hypothetical protein
MSKVPWFCDFGVCFADIALPEVPAGDGPLPGAVFLAARQACPFRVGLHCFFMSKVALA